MKTFIKKKKKINSKCLLVQDTDLLGPETLG